MTLSVAGDATMVGTFVNSGAGETGTVVGATHPDGRFNATFKVSGSGEEIAIVGTMAKVEDGLVGDGEFTRPGQATRGISFDLTGDSEVVANPFAGAYAGVWLANGLADTGWMTISIAANSQIVGSYRDVVNLTTGRVAGLVDVDGTFTATLIEDGSGQTTLVNGVMTDGVGGRTGVAGDGTYEKPGNATHAFVFDLGDSTQQNPFAGSMVGATWNVFGTTHGGSLNMTISVNGVINGNFTDTGTGETGRIVGLVRDNGVFDAYMITNTTFVRTSITGGLTKDDGSPPSWAGDGTYDRPGEGLFGFHFEAISSGSGS